MRNIALILGSCMALLADAQFGPAKEIIRSSAGSTTPYDMDLDGDMDLIIGGLLYENTGNGSFLVPRDAFINPVYYFTNLPKLALDVNNDGILDLVGSGAQTMLRDAQGGYVWHAVQPASSVDFGREDFADLDGDGDLDCALLHNTGYMQRYQNDGTGRYTTMDNIFAGVPGPFTTTISHLADLDGDGDNDLLLSNSRVMLNDGSGNFALPEFIQFGSPSNDLVVADLDGDGLVDIAFVEDIPFTHSFLWIQYNLGGLQFGNAVQLDLSQVRMNALETDDLDADGDLDLLVNQSDSGFAWVENLGAGSWAQGVEVRVPGWDELTLAWQDMNGDGDLDVVTERGWVANLGNGQYSSEQHFVTMSAKTRLTSADLDQDGRTELIAIPGNNTSGTVLSFGNDGTENFTEGRVIHETLVGTNTFDLLDLNGDGIPDRLTSTYLGSDYLFQWAPGDGVGGNGPTIDLAQLPYVAHFDIADLNMDGLPDIILAQTFQGQNIYCLYNLGNDQFSAPVVIVGADEAYIDGNMGSTCADLDGDGDPDLVICDGSMGTNADILWKVNDGTGAFPGIPQVIRSNYWANEPLCTDVNGDGVLDLVCSEPINDLIELAIHQPGGGFVFTTLYTGYDLEHFGLQLADPDGDGDMDILFGERNTGVWMLEAIGGGAFLSAQLVYAVPVPLSAFELVDLDGDGALDMAALIEDGQRLVWHHNFSGHTYQIGGTVFYDANANGIRDEEDPPFPLHALHVLVAPTDAQLLANDQGVYTYSTVPGDYTITATLPVPFWNITTPLPMAAMVNADEPVDLDNHIGVIASVDTLVMHSTLALGNGPCGSQRELYAGLNAAWSTVAFSADCTLEFDTMLTVAEAATAALVTDSSVVWSSIAMYPWSIWNESLIVELPGVQHLGETLDLTLTCVALDGNGVPLDTVQAASSRVILCSYDPNDKLVDPAGYGEQGVVPLDTERLVYTVRFQNTGTAAAQDVLIVDQLPPQLRKETLQILATTHTLTEARVDDQGLLIFQFTGINLPDSASDPVGSQGAITFGLLVEPGLPSGTLITNEASIHFDLNAPVLTPPVTNKLVDCSLFSTTIELSGFDELVATAGIDYQWYVGEVPITGATGDTHVPEVNGYYSVQVTDSDGCVAVSPEFPFFTTALDAHVDNVPFSIHPVPFMEQAIITMATMPVGTVHLEVTDLLGRRVRSIPITGTHTILGRADLASGPYGATLVVDGVVKGRRALVVY